MTTPRSRRPDEITELGELLDDVFRRSRGITDQSQLTDFPLVYSHENSCNSRVIVEDGRIVSHAALWPRELIVGDERLKAGVIVSVATHPEYRLRGHAASLMRDLQKTIHEEGYDFAILWTVVPEFYRKLGWEQVVPNGKIVQVDSKAIEPPQESGDELTPFVPQRHLDAVMALHDGEPIRFGRSRDEALKLLLLPKVNVWVALRDSQVAGYLVDSEACNKPGFIEYGGDLQAITSLAAKVLQDRPRTNVRWIVYHNRPDLASWTDSSELPSQPLESSKGFGSEMIYVPDAHRVSKQVIRDLFVWGLDWA